MHDVGRDETGPQAGALPSVTDAPVNSFMPMPESDKSKALEGCLLGDFMASPDDRRRLESGEASPA